MPREETSGRPYSNSSRLSFLCALLKKHLRNVHIPLCKDTGNSQPRRMECHRGCLGNSRKIHVQVYAHLRRTQASPFSNNPMLWSQELEASRHQFSNIICSSTQFRQYRVLILPSSSFAISGCTARHLKTKDNDVTRAVTRIRLGKPGTVRFPKHTVSSGSRLKIARCSGRTSTSCRPDILRALLDALE